MKNTLIDLNNHLFAEMERLSDEDLVGENLEEEIRRAGAIKGISEQVISNADLVLKAAKFADDQLNAEYKLPKLLSGEK